MPPSAGLEPARIEAPRQALDRAEFDFAALYAGYHASSAAAPGA